MRFDHLRRLRRTLQRQYQRHHSRRQLLRLDRHLLDDIGISRSDAEHEAGKPFWR